MRQIIGKSEMKNSLWMRFELQSRTDSPHTCSISFRTIKSTIVPWPIKIGLTSCPQSRSNIIGKGKQPKSRIFLLLERSIILKATDSLGSWVGRMQLLVSYATIKYPTTRRLSITVPSTIVWFSRRQEFLSKIICCIVLKTVLASIPTSRP